MELEGSLGCYASRNHRESLKRLFYVSISECLITGFANFRDFPCCFLRVASRVSSSIAISREDYLSFLHGFSQKFRFPSIAHSKINT